MKDLRAYEIYRCVKCANNPTPGVCFVHIIDCKDNIVETYVKIIGYGGICCVHEDFLEKVTTEDLLLI